MTQSTRLTWSLYQYTDTGLDSEDEFLGEYDSLEELCSNEERSIQDELKYIEEPVTVNRDVTFTKWTDYKEDNQVWIFNPVKTTLKEWGTFIPLNITKLDSVLTLRWAIEHQH